MKPINKKRIAILPWPAMENCFLVLSGQINKKSARGDKWYDGHIEHTQDYDSSSETLKARITFTYKNDIMAAEWDGEYGPIAMWFKCEEDFTDGYEKARRHWLFPFAYGSGHWSQIAVDDYGLVEAFKTGDYEKIFSTLKLFVDERTERMKHEKCKE